jgi:hypothetical protein
MSSFISRQQSNQIGQRFSSKETDLPVKKKYIEQGMMISIKILLKK